MTEYPVFEYVEEKCVCCRKPTTSHPTLNGYLCHTCYTDRHPEEITDSLPVDPFRGDETTPADCLYCGEQASPESAHTPGTDAVAIVKSPEGKQGSGMLAKCEFILTQSCPACGRITGHPLEASTAARLMDVLNLCWEPVEHPDAWMSVEG
jgi:hypothetical protein